MTIEEAIERVRVASPFAGYVNEARIAGSYREVLPRVIGHVPAGGRVLDFGAGACDKAALLALLGFESHAADDLLDPGHLRHDNREKIRSFAESFGVRLTLLEGSGPWPWEPDSFDMVMLHDVLEHLHDSPRELLNRLLERLKPDGLLFVTVPNAGNLRKRLALLLGGTNHPEFESFYWEPGPWRGHVREYVRGDLEALARLLDLSVVELDGCHNMIGTLRPALRGVWRLVSAPFPGWRDSWLLLGRKRPGWRPRREPPPGFLERSATASLMS